MKHTGKVNPVPWGLVHRGPLVRVVLTPHPIIVGAHKSVGLPIPGKIVNLMVDTGASRTVINNDIAQEIGAQPIAEAELVGVTGKPKTCPVYRMTITIGMQDSSGKQETRQFVSDIVGVDTEQPDKELHGLLGRDFLRYVKLVYDGPSGSFEIIDVPEKSRPESVARTPAKVARGLADKLERRKREGKERRKAQIEAQRKKTKRTRKKKRRKRKKRNKGKAID